MAFLHVLALVIVAAVTFAAEGGSGGRSLAQALGPWILLEVRGRQIGIPTLPCVLCHIALDPQDENGICVTTEIAGPREHRKWRNCLQHNETTEEWVANDGGSEEISLRVLDAVENFVTLSDGSFVGVLGRLPQYDEDALDRLEGRRSVLNNIAFSRVSKISEDACKIV